MNKIKFLCLVFSLIFTVQAFAQETASITVDIIPTEGMPITMAFNLNDNSNIISNSSESSIELLRRLGRAISTNWPEGKKIFNAATILFPQYYGTPDFSKTFTEDNLSKQQLDDTARLLANYGIAFDVLGKEYEAASEAVTIKMAADIKQFKKHLDEIIANNAASPAISVEDIKSIKEKTLPILDMFSDFYGITSISEKGIYGRINVESKARKLSDFISGEKLNLEEYIDNEPLIVLAQTHHIQDTAAAIKSLREMPNMAIVEQLVASAGLDFEKDIIANHAHESILYVSLAPTGEHLLPDVRWVALVPEIEKLVAKLPQFKQLCVNAGIFVAAIDSKVPDTSVVKLSHCMFPQYGIYASIVDKFCVIALSEEGAQGALAFLRKAISEKKQRVDLKGCSLYCRVKSKNLNVQLQQFLQTPYMVRQGIPPISNLTFLSEMKDLEVRSTLTEDKLQISVDMPFEATKDNNK